MSEYLLPDWFSNNIERFTEHLSHLVGTPAQCLEIGVAEGRCTKWLVENILTHPDSRIRCIDPWELKPFAEASFDEKIGRHRQVIKIKARSADALRLLPKHSLDFVYIDGNHEARYTMEDAVLSLPLLKPGGVMAFDDYNWDNFVFDKQTLGDDRQPETIKPPKPAIDCFIQLWSHCIDVLEISSQAWLRKK